MRKRISPLLSALTLFWITSSLSCASLGLLSPPALLNRTLRFSKALPQLEYQYWVCAKYTLWWCARTEMKVDTYDLTDPNVRAQLVDMGFVAKVRENP